MGTGYLRYDLNFTHPEKGLPHRASAGRIARITNITSTSMVYLDRRRSMIADIIFVNVGFIRAEVIVLDTFFFKGFETGISDKRNAS